MRLVTSSESQAIASHHGESPGRNWPDRSFSRGGGRSLNPCQFEVLVFACMLNAWLTLVWLSFRRMLWSTTTLMVSFPLLGTALFILRWRRWLPTGTPEELERSLANFTDGFVMVMFLTFLLPICALAYATSSLGSDREERTLVFLLTRPVPR